jgi:hypothetical protein
VQFDCVFAKPVKIKPQICFRVIFLNSFILPEYADLLRLHQLDNFKQLWNRPVDWFEAPNYRRGGWSGVARIKLTMNDKDHWLFIKKQENHGRWSLISFPKKEPTFRREFDNLQYLKSKQFAAPKVVFYGEQLLDEKLCAILITEELTGYTPLNQISEQFIQMGKSQKNQLLKNVASVLRNFHQLNRMHRALYPKHIFVADIHTTPKIALIDFEKTRFSPFFWYNAYFDLAALNRHVEGWSKSQKMFLFKQYFNINRLTWLSKLLYKCIILRSVR